MSEETAQINTPYTCGICGVFLPGNTYHICLNVKQDGLPKVTKGDTDEKLDRIIELLEKVLENQKYPMIQMDCQPSDHSAISKTVARIMADVFKESE